MEDIVVEPLIENSHAEIDASNLSCKQCEFVCEFKTSLNRHTMTFHGDRKYFDSAFKCKICGNGYKSNEGLASHFSYEHEKIPFKCSKLGLKNPTSEVHHTYQCHMCHYSSNYKESLKAHLNLVHKQTEAEIATVHGKRKKAEKPNRTGKSLSEALLFAEHGENMLCTKIVQNVRNNFCTQHVLPRFELGIFMY